MSEDKPLDGTHGVRFLLYADENQDRVLDDDERAAGPVYDEALEVSFHDGYYGAVLGLSDPGSLSAAVISRGPLLLEIAIDDIGEMPAQPLSATPYAFVSSHVEGSVVVPESGSFACEGCLDAADLFGNAVIQSRHLDDTVLEPRHFADGIIEGRHIEDGSLTGADVQDGTLSVADLQETLYTSKSNVRSYTASVQASTSTATVTASCADSNDLPLGSECDTGPANSAMSLKNIRNLNWTSSTNPASVECVALRTGGSFTETVTARIYCLEVP